MAQPVPAVSLARLRSIWDVQVAPSAAKAHALAATIAEAK